MKAMVLEQFGEPLRLKEVPVPELEPDEALVQVTACGVCGTDLKISGGKIEGTPLPLTMGHEPAGRVVGVGADVSNVKVGDHVAMALYVSCGICDFCRTNRDSLCINLIGRPGFELDGGFAEFFKVPSRNLFPISPTVPLEQVALLADCVATVWHAVRRRAEVQPGQTVVVMGAGGLGLHATQVIGLSGARTVAVDIVPEKLDLARTWGADETIDARDEDVAARVLELTGGIGADAILEFVGLPQVIETDLRFLKRGGVLVLLGYAPGQPFHVDSSDLVLTEKRIVGSRASSKQDLVEVIRLVEEGKITPVVTQRHKLGDVNKVLDALRTGEIMGRAVVLP
jgi:2-desacetyl-2-hydroxyethyl bacteriochlorophyllide A dehydrogenase